MATALYKGRKFDVPDTLLMIKEVNDSDKISIWGSARFYSAPRKINGG